MQSITLDQAKKLTVGQTIYTINYKNADGTLQRFRVNGKVKTWKRSPDRVQVPIKRGLYEYGYLDENNLWEFTLNEEC